jgi:hypothetical protein
VQSIPQLSLEFEVQEKECRICREVKPVSAFHRTKTDKTGYYSYCKACRSAKAKPNLFREKAALRQQGLKCCTGCGVVKPLDQFQRQANQSDGHKPKCRPCTKAVQSADYLANRDEYSARMREAYRANPEPYKARAQRRYREKPEAVKAKIWEWQKRNRVKVNAYHKKNRLANPDASRARVRKRYAVRKGAKSVKFTVQQLNQKRAYWANQCWVCKAEPDSWDHVKPLAKGGAHILANLRPICRFCNSSKQAKWPFAPVYTLLTP